MASTAGWGAVSVPTEDDLAGEDINGEALAASIRPKIIPTFATEAARNAAASALITANPAATLKCVVTGVGLCHHVGAGVWEYLSPIPPIVTTNGAGPSGQFGTSVGWPMLTATEWLPATWSFSPTRSGWADVWLDFDVFTVTPGFGYFVANPQFRDGGGDQPWQNLEGFPATIHHDSSTHGWYRQPALARIHLTQGKQAAFRLNVYAYYNAGGYQFGGMTWRVVQQ